MRLGLCVLIVASLLAGCNQVTKQASPSQRNENQNAPRVQNVQEQQNVTNDNQTKNDQMSKQRHLEELAKRTPGVNNAHCIIMGNTALVGIDVDAKLERARVGTIKYTVAEAIRKDPDGTRTIVTADVDLAQRIAEIGTKIREGHPISGFTTELADIIGRIVPQLPEDTKHEETNHNERNNNQRNQTENQQNSNTRSQR
ncbi:YhcN/YlaJ family sporulation lipoprotein [Paenibacillus turicensis]|uniref:YhcN/YlaJ family sporulation lipoprotein n=1 Tax=Paenibacillus turicensis TaxID=160487 RepID=A0ABS4FP53_9BACL|nr:YhcN/YlaJ family sporulation lipoprotein [Paenibacillus turicensis]MBP1904355.1 YhcN/YlaJ family sporulation lipoprotein [Paenibacillus turicensis]